MSVDINQMMVMNQLASNSGSMGAMQGGGELGPKQMGAEGNITKSLDAISNTTLMAYSFLKGLEKTSPFQDVNVGIVLPSASPMKKLPGLAAGKG